MEIGALAPYERALVADDDALGLRLPGGDTVTLDVGRWLEPVDGVDAAVLDRCRGSVLDVGSGPGRFVAELCRRGVDVLGVDVAQTAVEISTRQGLPAVRASVFDDIPRVGRWRTALLMDGNVGIGGDPGRLLRRLAEVQTSDGLLLAETDAEPDVLERQHVRFTEHGRAVGPPFAWARVGAYALTRLATDVGYDVTESWSEADRCFVALVLTRATR